MFALRHTVLLSIPVNKLPSSFTSSSMKNVKKGEDKERKNMEITFFPQPILTDSLSLTSLAFNTGRNNQPHRGHNIFFSMELFGCFDYQPDISMNSNLYKVT